MSLRSFLSKPIAPRIVVVGVTVVTIIVTIVGFANATSLFQRMVPASDDAIARHYIYLLRTNQVASILKTIDERVPNRDAQRGLYQAGNVLQKQINPHLKANGYRWDVGAAGKRVTFSYESSGDRSWAVILVSFMTIGDKVVLEALRVQPLSEPLAVTNALTFRGKGVAHYAWMLATVAIGLFVLVTLFSCAWEPYVQFRWIWLLVIVIGIAKLSMNWTTGESVITPISFAVPPIAFYRSGLDMPWIVSFLLPVGAVLYWFFREKLKLKKQPALEAGTELAPGL